MKCILLAAGYATRMYPLTKNFPKPLLEVGGSTILDRLIDDLRAGGLVDEFIVITNHKFAEIFAGWAQKKPYAVTVIDDGTCTNETRLGAVRDIRLALEQKEIREDVLVLAGDNVLDFSLCRFVEFALEKNTSCVMCHKETDLIRQQKTAIITVDDTNRITSYEEKPLVPKGDLAVPPFYFYKAQDIGRVPEALSDGCGYDAPGSFAAWLSRKTSMHAFPMPGKRYDVGSIEGYENIKKLF